MVSVAERSSAGLSVGLEAPRFRVLDTYVHSVAREEVSSILHGFLSSSQPRQVVTVNIDFLRIASSSPSFNDLINGADLAVTDGRPLVWIAHYLGLSTCERVTGPDVIEACARLSAAHGYRLFLLGSQNGIPERAQLAMESAFPGVNICGVYSPPVADYPFPEPVQKEIVERVQAAEPDALFVAFGCPKQDLWIRDNLKSLNVPLSVGVGASFDFISGLIPRAPRTMQAAGLEWLYRLRQEPRRLWRRYLCHDLPFVMRIAALELRRKARLARQPVLEVVAGQPI
jgi:N-acetylglucosaminyldiphosphoundecaprenol N-acetyl-beta-D-mannosaminyltransferase